MDKTRRDEVGGDGRLWCGLALTVFLLPMLAAATAGTLMLFHYLSPTAKLPVRAGFPVAVLSALAATVAAASGVRIARLPAVWSAVAAAVGFAIYVALTLVGFLAVGFIVWARRL